MLNLDKLRLQVVRSRSSYAWSYLQCTLHSMVVDFCRAYLYLVTRNRKTASNGNLNGQEGIRLGGSGFL